MTSGQKSLLQKIKGKGLTNPYPHDIINTENKKGIDIMKDFNINFYDLTDSEIQCLYDRLYAEKVRRENLSREKDWDEVVTAMTNFMQKHGCITVRDELDDVYVNIEGDWDFSTIGEISK